VLVRQGHGVGALAASCQDGTGTDAAAEEYTVALEINTEDFLAAHESCFSMLRMGLRIASRGLIEEHGSLPVSPVAADPDPGVWRDSPLTFAERLMREQEGLVGKTSLVAATDWIRRCEEVKFSAGETLWRAGDRTGYGFHVDCGLVRCSTPTGTSVVAGKGIVLGSLDAMSEQPHSYTAEASTDLIGFRHDHDGLIALLHTHPKVGMRFKPKTTGILHIFYP
jgi:hypothetical protein